MLSSGQYHGDNLHKGTIVYICNHGNPKWTFKLVSKKTHKTQEKKSTMICLFSSKIIVQKIKVNITNAQENNWCGRKVITILLIFLALL